MFVIFTDVKQALIGVGLVVQEYNYASLQDSKGTSSVVVWLSIVYHDNSLLQI
jgi:hypothetical protein